MTTDPWKIPYPSDEEIERQSSQIVRQAFPKKRSFWHQLHEVKDQMGWQYLLPNRSEWVVAILIVALLIYTLLHIVSNKQEQTFVLYNYAFFTSPLPVLLLSLYAMYEKREKQVMELEMTFKITIFQIIALRMITFSAIGLLISVTISFVLAIQFDVSFLRMWLISLAGLFTFTALLLSALSYGEVWRKAWGVTIGWVVINITWMIALPDSYNEFLFNLPLVIYAGILFLSFITCCYTFTRTFLRKQEGLGLC